MKSSAATSIITMAAVAAGYSTGAGAALTSSSLRGPSSIQGNENEEAAAAGHGIETVGRDQREHFPDEQEELQITRNGRNLENPEEDEDAELYADIDILGNVVEDPISDSGLYYWDEDDVPITVEYAPDPNTILLEGSDLLGGSSFFPANNNSTASYTYYAPLDDEYDHGRRVASAANNPCSGSGDDDQGSVMIVLQTDLYGYETSWKILDDNYAVASGPPANTRYDDSKNYSGRWCLPSGTYRVVVSDKGGNGMCPGNPSGGGGCGFFKVYLNGELSGQIVSDKSAWSNKEFTVNVAPVSSRIDGAASSSSSSGGGGSNQQQQQQWCSKVKSVMKVPQGTCTLSNGSRGHRVRVTTKVDKYGQETSWKITRGSGGGGGGSAVAMKMGPIVPSNSVKAVEDCLPPGDYNLAFSDLDGICCKHGQGYYNLIVDGQQLLEGGAFISSVNHDFKLGHDWVSNMSERDCEWWWAHDYRRRDWHTRCYKGQYCNKSYRYMRWSASLKADAQDYAQRLLATCNDEAIHHDASDYGENLAKNKGSGIWGQLYPADRITKRFVDNEEFWGWNDNAHLTQSMWYATRYIGCGESVKTMSNGETCRFQVCRYAKPGNCVMGQYNADQGNNWMAPMMADDSPCKPLCPTTGCHL